jgi:ribosome-binding protein aMBF1 (putative translation factor)
MTIEQRRERAAGNAEALSGSRHRQLQGIEAELMTSPGCGGLCMRDKRVKFPEIKTLDTSKTPKAGDARSAPKPVRRPAIAKRPPNSDPIAAAIVRARSIANLTQAQLADRLKTDQGNIARLERGRSQATIRTLKRIAEATGHSLVVDFRPIQNRQAG